MAGKSFRSLLIVLSSSVSHLRRVSKQIGLVVFLRTLGEGFRKLGLSVMPKLCFTPKVPTSETHMLIVS